MQGSWGRAVLDKPGGVCLSGSASARKGRGTAHGAGEGVCALACAWEAVSGIREAKSGKTASS